MPAKKSYPAALSRSMRPSPISKDHVRAAARGAVVPLRSANPRRTGLLPFSPRLSDQTALSVIAARDKPRLCDERQSGVAARERDVTSRPRRDR